LLDVNVWIALAVAEHVHHAAALQWYSAIRNESLAVCRITELGLLRLLTNARVMDGAPLTASGAWQVRDRLLNDPKIQFVEEVEDFEAHWRRASSGGQIGPNYWTDAYLVCLCTATDSTLVTFHRPLSRQHRFKVLLLQA
jgi:toxin-antitoxin system PIN domain toxin